MAAEPLLIYSHRIDPVGVVESLVATGAEVKVTGNAECWSRIVVRGNRRLGWRKKLIVTHRPDYYEGPNWPDRLDELATFCLRYREGGFRTEILRGIRQFRFCISLVQSDVSIDVPDERHPWIAAICERLDGVLFSLSTFRDGRGRILASCGDDCDPAAELPASFRREANIDADDRGPVDDCEDETPIEPPSPHRVASRAMVLAAVANRGMLEVQRDMIDDPESERKKLLDWIEEVGVSAEVEPQEWKLLRCPVGRLADQAKINAVWRLEGLGVLCWALEWHELPAYDELVEMDQLWDATEIWDTAAAIRLVRDAQLRGGDELSEYCTHATMAHWRMRNFFLRPEAVDFVAMSRDCWIGEFDLSRFRILKGDLAIGNRPIAKADPQHVGKTMSAAMERHLAANWLVGWNSDVYSETDTST
jgi:hypothetical protein